MPQSGTIFRALVASPSDCAHERKIIPEVIAAWNAVHSLNSRAIIEPVLWETHSRPAMGNRPQELINQQLVINCDLVIGAFWTRLGTPTGVAESGTAEEIEQFRVAGKPVLLYFSSAPVILDSIDWQQYSALSEYKSELLKKGLCFSYDDLSGLREQLQRHLAGHMIDLLKAVSISNDDTVPSQDPEMAHKHALATFLADFKAFLRRLASEWDAERDSEPHSTDDGKYILSRAADEIIHFKSMIVEDSDGLADQLGSVLTRIRTHQRHQTYLDGGVSFQRFWDEGDDILRCLRNTSNKLESLATST